MTDALKLEPHLNVANVSSDEDGENCPICLNTFRDQAVGTPENCSHYFCLDCIVEWSKVSCWGLISCGILMCSALSDHTVLLS